MFVKHQLLPQLHEQCLKTFLEWDLCYWDEKPCTNINEIAHEA